MDVSPMELEPYENTITQAMTLIQSKQLTVAYELKVKEFQYFLEVEVVLLTNIEGAVYKQHLVEKMKKYVGLFALIILQQLMHL